MTASFDATLVCGMMAFCTTVIVSAIAEPSEVGSKLLFSPVAMLFVLGLFDLGFDYVTTLYRSPSEVDL